MTRKLALGAAGAASLLALLTLPFWWRAFQSPEPPIPLPDDTLSREHAPNRWEPGAEQASTPTDVTLQLDPRRGPVWTDGARRLALTPLPRDWSEATWSRRQTARGFRVVGEGVTGGQTLTVTWQFAEGNPQATLHYRLEATPLETLANQQRTLALALPAGPTTYVDGRFALQSASAGDELSLSAWRPQWVRWSGGPMPLTLSGWTGDGWRLHSADDGTTTLDFTLWAPERHLAPVSCQRQDNSPDGLRVPLEAGLTLSFGDLPVALPSPFARAHAAAAAPIFDTPRAHPDATLRDGAARDAADWVDRVRTLARGHSSTDDPRWGNGGLLGHGLGGTVVLPADYTDHPPLLRYLDELGDTALDVAVRLDANDPASEAALSGLPEHVSVIIGAATGCRPTHPSAPEDASRPMLGFLPRFEAAANGLTDLLAGDVPRMASPANLLPVAVSAGRLDGSRSSLLQDTLHEEVLTRLSEGRGLAVFATPLLGSRNPLIPAARESLLKPERHGEWTLSAPFAAALADLELWQEAHPIWLTGLSRLVDHWSTARRATLRWTPEGDLKVRAPERTGVAGLKGFSLFWPGQTLDAASITVDGESPRGLRRDAGGTWMWWNLADGRTHRLQHTGDATDKKKSGWAPPRPIRWQWQ